MEANRNLNYLIDALDKEGLFLNTSKTKMIDLQGRESAEEDHKADPAAGKPEEFDPVDTETKIEELIRVRGHYTTRIVKTYRCPGEEQIKVYQRMDLDGLKATLDRSIDEPEDSIRNFIKAFIYQKRAKVVSDLCEVLGKHIHYVPYIVDALIKEQKRFNEAERNALRDFFADILNGDQCTEYYKIAAFRLCSESAYDGLAICRDYIDYMPIALSPVTQREVIMRMAELGDRPALVSLRSRYGHFSLPARRAIFYCWKMTDKVLPAEKRAFMKTLNKTEADPLISREAGKLIAAI